eukprot:Lithocolla_globosa_v1_NODE_1929_length_2256_cov_6.611995.p2 type:complete len:146 gc:universal NODE_1929_length_2256_cov_6.611995:1235-798(-)
MNFIIIGVTGLRTTAKLILNSFWGKLGQRDNMEKCVFIDNPEEYYRLHRDKNIEITDFQPLGENIVYMTYKNRIESVEPSRNTNVYHAIYTTSQARLMLYELMDKLGDRVLYHDTDSVIYIEDEDCPEVKLGDFLGDLTDELKGR